MKSAPASKNSVTRRSNAVRTAETLNKLLAAARPIFVRDGFAGAATDEIVKSAGVTRGALYHHFANKEELFRAVVEHEAAAIAADIGATDNHATSPADALRRGADAYFKAMATPGRSALMLTEGPSALGWAVMNDIDQRNGGGELLAGLTALTNRKIDPKTLDALAAILSAAFDRAAIEINQGADPAPYRRAIDLILTGLD